MKLMKSEKEEEGSSLEVLGKNHLPSTTVVEKPTGLVECVVQDGMSIEKQQDLIVTTKDLEEDDDMNRFVYDSSCKKKIASLRNYGFKPNPNEFDFDAGEDNTSTSSFKVKYTNSSSVLATEKLTSHGKHSWKRTPFFQFGRFPACLWFVFFFTSACLCTDAFVYKKKINEESFHLKSIPRSVSFICFSLS